MEAQDKVDRIHLSQMFELLLERFPDIIQSVDDAGNIVYANRRACELLGYTRDELAGKTIADVYAPEIMDDVKAGFRQLKRDGSLTVSESIMVDKQGSRIPVEIRSFAVYAEDGRFLRTFSVIRDIRLLKRLQDSLCHRFRLAAIGELASCVAHDISNPLSVIKLYDEWLATELRAVPAAFPAEQSERIQEGLRNIDRAAQAIEKLVTHLREFARSREAKPEPVDLRKTLDDAVFMVSHKVMEYNIRVERRWPPQPCLIEGHPCQVEQIFMNILRNACEAMEGRAPQLPPPTITLAVEPRPDPLGGDGTVFVCTVRDNGKGMTPDVSQHAFEPFYTTKRSREGTGLGLSIVRNAVRRHGGTITIESEPDKGTTVSVCLPARPPAA